MKCASSRTVVHGIVGEIEQADQKQHPDGQLLMMDNIHRDLVLLVVVDLDVGDVVKMLLK